MGEELQSLLQRRLRGSLAPRIHCTHLTLKQYGFSYLPQGSWESVCLWGGERREPPLTSARLLPDRRDSSGIRLYYTATLRRFDAGIMELGLVYTPVMAIPPQETAFVLTGYCTDKCTQLVSGAVLVPLPRPCRWWPRKDSRVAVIPSS